MTRVLFDLDVLLDFLTCRPGHAEAEAALALADSRRIEGVLCAHELPTLAFFLEKEKETPAAIRNLLKRFCGLFEIVELTRPIIQDAIHGNIDDFEDGLIAASALRSKCGIILTRNLRDFQHSKIPAMGPKDFLKSFKA